MQFGWIVRLGKVRVTRYLVTAIVVAVGRVLRQKTGHRVVGLRETSVLVLGGARTTPDSRFCNTAGTHRFFAIVTFYNMVPK